MSPFVCSDKEWSKINDYVYSLCMKERIDFCTNITEREVIVRPEKIKRVYESIKSVLKTYEKVGLVEVHEPRQTYGDSGETIIEVVRK